MMAAWMAASTAAQMGAEKAVPTAVLWVAWKVVHLAAKLAHPWVGTMADDSVGKSVAAKVAVTVAKMAA